MPEIEKGRLSRRALLKLGAATGAGAGITYFLRSFGDIFRPNTPAKASEATPAPTAIPTRPAETTSIPATVTSTPTQLPTETPKPTVKPTERPANTATAIPSPTESTIREIPTLIPEGQLPQYVELTSIETLAQKSKESRYEQLPFALAFSDLEGVRMENATEGKVHAWIIDVKNPVDFVSFVNTKAISFSSYGTDSVANGPIVVVQTEEELRKMNGPNNNVSPSFIIALPGKGNLAYRELIIVPYKNPKTEIERKSQPGDIIKPGDVVVTIKNGRFLVEIVDHYTDGKREYVATLDSFIKVGNKLAAPNNNLASGK